MLYIKNINSFSKQKNERNNAIIVGSGAGAGSGLIMGGGLGVSAATGHAISGMTDHGYNNDLAGGITSIVGPAMGGLLVGGVPGAITHGLSGLGGYIHGKLKRNKEKKKAKLGDILTTGTVVGLGGATAGMIGGGIIGGLIGANNKNFQQKIAKRMELEQELQRNFTDVKNASNYNFSWFDNDIAKKMKKLRKIAQEIKKNGIGTKSQKYALFKEEAMKTGLFDSKDNIHKSFIDVLFD